MNNTLVEISNIIFDLKEEISDGQYLILMNKLKELKEQSIPNPVPIVLQRPTTRDIAGVIESWILNQNSRTRNRSFSSQEGNLYSYELLIGYTENDCKYLLNHTADGLGFVSMTTSQHIGRIKRYCSENSINLTIS